MDFPVNSLAAALMYRLHSTPSVQLTQKGDHWVGNSVTRNGDSKKCTFSMTADGRLMFRDNKEPSISGGEKELAAWWPDFDLSQYDLGTGQMRSDSPMYVGTTKRDYRNIEDYAEAHGVDVETFNKLGFKEVSHFSTLYKKDGEVRTLNMQKKAIEFEVNGQKRYRVLEKTDTARYMQDYTFKPAWFGLTRATAKAATLGKPLVLVNGEITAAIAQSYGIPACVVGGGGEKQIPFSPENDLLAELQQKWKGDIWICLDCDAQGMKYSKEIATQLQMNRRGIVSLGFSSGADLLDFLRVHAGPERNKAAAVEKFWALKVEMAMATEVDAQVFGAQELTFAMKGVEIALQKFTQQQMGGEKAALMDAIDRASNTLDRVRGLDVGQRIQRNEIVVDNTIALVDKAWNNPDPNGITGLATGLLELDIITGGLRKGSSYCFLAPTGGGKSTLAANIAANIVNVGGAVAIMPTELTPEEYTIKMACALTSISAEAAMRGRFTSQKQYLEYREVLLFLKNDAKIGWLKGNRPTASDIRVGLRRIVNEDIRQNIDLLVLDSMTNAAPVMDVNASNIIYDEVMNSAKEHDTPVVFTLQADTKNIEKRPYNNRIALLSDAQGAQRSIQDPAMVFSIFNYDYWVRYSNAPEDPKFPKGHIYLYLLKQRFGFSESNVIQFRFPNGACFQNMEDTPF